MTASGTVTLEAAILETPMIVAYKVSRLSKKIGLLLIRSKFAGLPNVIAGREIVPEFVREDPTGPRLADCALKLLMNPALLDEQRLELRAYSQSAWRPRHIRPGRAARPGYGWKGAMRFLRQVAWTAYEAALCLSWPALYFYYFCRSRTDGKYRDNYLSRMGRKLPAPLGPGPGRAWIHALSVGEALSSIALIAELKQMRPALEIIFSTSTETGMSLAMERLKGLVDEFFFMPHDFPWTVYRLLKRVRPSLFVLIETDFWPNLLWRLNTGRRSRSAGQRESVASFVPQLLPAGPSRGVIFSGFDLIFAQTELDRARFISMGCLSQKVMAAGNLKFESSMSRVPESEIASIRAGIGVEAGRPVWVAGSTHEGEEQILLRIHGPLERSDSEPASYNRPEENSARDRNCGSGAWPWF